MDSVSKHSAGKCPITKRATQKQLISNWRARKRRGIDQTGAIKSLRKSAWYHINPPHDAKLTVRTLGPENIYRRLSGPIRMTGEKKVALNIHLRVRNRRKCVSRSISWNYSKKTIDVTMIERSVLETICCRIRAMLQKAQDKLSEEIDFAN